MSRTLTKLRRSKETGRASADASGRRARRVGVPSAVVLARSGGLCHTTAASGFETKIKLHMSDGCVL